MKPTTQVKDEDDMEKLLVEHMGMEDVHPSHRINIIQRLAARSAEATANVPDIKVPQAASTKPPSPPESERYLTFHPFPDLPTEIRLNIWSLVEPTPFVLVACYDVVDRKVQSLGNYGYPSDPSSSRGDWVITNPLRNPFVRLSTRAVCQESRSEAKKYDFSAYETLRLTRNITQQSWFNFETDILFLNTNANFYDRKAFPPGEGNPFMKFSRDDRYGHYRHRMYFLNDNEVEEIEPMDKLRNLAIGRALWNDWPFIMWLGDDITGDRCPGWGSVIDCETFKEKVCWWASSTPKELGMTEPLNLMLATGGDEVDTDLMNGVVLIPEILTDGRMVAVNDGLDFEKLRDRIGMKRPPPPPPNSDTDWDYNNGNDDYRTEREVIMSVVCVEDSLGF